MNLISATISNAHKTTHDNTTHLHHKLQAVELWRMFMNHIYKNSRTFLRHKPQKWEGQDFIMSRALLMVTPKQVKQKCSKFQHYIKLYLATIQILSVTKTISGKPLNDCLGTIHNVRNIQCLLVKNVRLT